MTTDKTVEQFLDEITGSDADPFSPQGALRLLELLEGATPEEFKMATGMLARITGVEEYRQLTLADISKNMRQEISGMGGKTKAKPSPPTRTKPASSGGSSRLERLRKHLGE
jgi:hypothetical protein